QRAQREAEAARRHAEAAAKARAIYDDSLPAPANHPSLTRKRVQPHGLRVADWHGGKCLVVPVLEKGRITSLQFIKPDGTKRFLPGGKTSGCYFTIGDPRHASRIVMAEGYATGATLHE